MCPQSLHSVWQVQENCSTNLGSRQHSDQASAEEDGAKARKQEAANHIKDLMGNHDKAVCGEHKVSWKGVTSERLDTKALKADEPDLYAKYVKSSTSRRFTLK